MAEKRKPDEAPAVKGEWAGGSTEITRQQARAEALAGALAELQRQLLGQDVGATLAAALNLEHARGLCEAGCALEPELADAIALAVAEVVALVVDLAR